MRSFDVVYRFRPMPTLSNNPPERANTVVIVVVVVVVDVARRRNAKKMQRTACVYYCRSLVLHAMDIYLTSWTIFDQYAAELSASNSKLIDNSM